MLIGASISDKDLAEINARIKRAAEDERIELEASLNNALFEAELERTIAEAEAREIDLEMKAALDDALYQAEKNRIEADAIEIDLELQFAEARTADGAVPHLAGSEETRTGPRH